MFLHNGVIDQSLIISGDNTDLPRSVLRVHKICLFSSHIHKLFWLRGPSKDKYNWDYLGGMSVQVDGCIPDAGLMKVKCSKPQEL
jgi:hypothetical protein